MWCPPVLAWQTYVQVYIEVLRSRPSATSLPMESLHPFAGMPCSLMPARAGMRCTWLHVDPVPLRPSRSGCPPGVYFWVYEACRELFEPGSRASGSNSLLALWAAGGVGGAVSWLSVYPADVVKSRLQAAGAAGQASPYKGAHIRLKHHMHTLPRARTGLQLCTRSSAGAC